MAERFEKLYSLPDNLYIEGSPVIISAGALLKDNNTDKVLVQLKLRNVGTKNILAVKVSIKAYEPNGAEVEGVENSQYIDLDVQHSEEFGQKSPIYLPNKSTRRFDVAVTEVVLKGAPTWESDFKEWQPLPKQQEVYAFKDRELQKQFVIEAGNGKRTNQTAEYIPDITLDLFRCTCGNLNQQNSTACLVCGRQKDTLFKASNVEFLKSQRDIRLEEEKKIAEQKAQELARQREIQQAKIKKFKRIAIPAGIVAALAIFVTVLFTSIIPSIKYSNAETLLNEGEYEEAYNAFDELGGFKDSAEIKNTVWYKAALKELEADNYSKALECSDKLSKEQLSEIIDKIKGVASNLKSKASTGNYGTSYNRTNNEKYLEAAEIYSLLIPYDDSWGEFAKEKANCEGEYHCNLGKNYFENTREYTKALKEFQKAQKCNISSAKVFVSMSNLKIAQRKIKKGDTSEGLKMLKQVLIENSWRPVYYVSDDEKYTIRFLESGKISSTDDYHSNDINDGESWWLDNQGNLVVKHFDYEYNSAKHDYVLTFYGNDKWKFEVAYWKGDGYALTFSNNDPSDSPYQTFTT